MLYFMNKTSEKLSCFYTKKKIIEPLHLGNIPSCLCYVKVFDKMHLRAVYSFKQRCGSKQFLFRSGFGFRPIESATLH